MRLWKGRDEEILRKELRNRVAAAPVDLKKRFKKAEKVKALWRRKASRVVWGMLCALIFPGLLFFPFFEQADEMGRPLLFSYGMWFIAGIVAMFVRGLFSNCTELWLSRILPVSFEQVHRAISDRLTFLLWGSGLSGIFYFSIWTQWYVDPAAPLSFAWLHTVAFLFSILVLARIPNGWYTFALVVGALVFWFSGVYLSGGKALLDFGAMLLPNGWVMQAADAVVRGELFWAGVWLCPLLLGVPLFCSLKKMLSRGLEHLYETVEIDECEDDFVEGGFELNPDEYGWLSRLLRKSLSEELRPFYDYFVGPLCGGNRLWISGGVVAVASTLWMVWGPPFLQTPVAYVLGGILVIVSPLTGIAKFNGQNEDAKGPLVAHWALYPVDIPSLVYSIRRVCFLRCCFAFPFWLLGGVGFGFRVGDVGRGLIVATCWWSCLLVIQLLIPILNLTLISVKVVKHKFLRRFVSGFMSLVWLLSLLASVILSVYVPQGRDFFIPWLLTLGFGLGAVGWLFSLWLLREVCGKDCDLVSNR
ncbi:hypothetical protein P0Y35_14735 [Kiritimatiellaeota bacterium B1221]|nr:hypothetical protein [Kiritimatiellaeota bacterium B1221]